MSRVTVAMLGVVLSTAACTGPQAAAVNQVGEPIRIETGQFVRGAVPGLPEPDSSSPEAGVSPEVIDIDVPNTAIAQGELGLLFSGHTSVDAQSVGIRFADLGAGYWVVPVEAPDPSDNGLLTWQASADFGRNLPPGIHDLVFAAIGADGSSGSQSDLPVCIDTPVPDNLNICVPKRAPPAAVLSLSWNTPVNLDLLVQTPSGAVIGDTTKTATSEAGTTESGGDGVLDRDSNRNCVIDNIDREDIVWPSKPATGTYAVWVDLYSACGQPSVTFTVSLWLAEPQPDGTQRLIEQQPPLANGLLTAEQANGGSSPGLYVGDFVLE